MHFSNIFDEFGRMLTGLLFPLISFLPFLYKGVISACLRISGNVDNFMELLNLLQRKLLKSYTNSYREELYEYKLLVIPQFWRQVTNKSLRTKFSAKSRENCACEIVAKSWCANN